VTGFDRNIGRGVRRMVLGMLLVGFVACGDSDEPGEVGRTSTPAGSEESPSPSPEGTTGEPPGTSAGVPGPEGSLTPAQALQAEGNRLLPVKGFVVSSGGQTRLCESLSESSPPQCGGSSIVLQGYDTSGLQEAGGVSWSPELILEILVRRQGDVFVVDNTVR
jgi:hypothetical protein